MRIQVIQAHFKSAVIKESKGIVVLDLEWLRYRVYVYRLPFSPERQDAPLFLYSSCTSDGAIRWRGSIYRYTRSNAAEKFARKSPTFQ